MTQCTGCAEGQVLGFMVHELFVAPAPTLLSTLTDPEPMRYIDIRTIVYFLTCNDFATILVNNTFRKVVCPCYKLSLSYVMNLKLTLITNNNN